MTSTIDKAPPKYTHPVVFLLLIIPFGAASGFLGVTIVYQLGTAGVDPVTIAVLTGLSFLPHTFKFLYAPLVDLTLTRKQWFVMASITSAVGIAMLGVIPATQAGLPWLRVLVVAGNFVTRKEQAEFDELKRNPEFAATVQHVGFVSSEQKKLLLLDTDLFLFPTRYLGENQPVNLIEAMAFGLPMVTTRWRSLPEMLPPDYPGLVRDQDPDEIAAAILKLLALDSSAAARHHFITHFTLERHLASLAEAIRSVEN